MNPMRKRFARMLWYCSLIGVIALGLVSIVGTGGGSDDSGGSGSDTPPVYDFTIDMNPSIEFKAEPQIAIVPEKPGPLEVSFSDGENDYELNLSGRIEGTLDTSHGDITVGTDSQVTVSDMGDIDPAEYLGFLIIDVTTEFAIPQGGPPRVGSIAVQSPRTVSGLSLPQVAPDFETITVTIAVDSSDRAGVTITTDDPAADPNSVFKTWEQTDALLDGEGPLWQQKGAFGVDVIKFVLDQADRASESFSFISDYEADLETAGDGETIELNCSEFPDGNVPADLDKQGTITFGWDDDSDDGSVGSGDSFSWYFNDCWNDNFDDGDLNLYETGGVIFNGYTQEKSGEFIARAGYEPDEGPGGVFYDNLVLGEVEDSDGTYTYDSDYSVNLGGGFTLIYELQN